MTPLETYARRIAEFRADHPGCDIRVRVIPQKQCELIQQLAFAGMPIVYDDCDAGTHRFARNVLGANEWVMDHTIPAPVVIEVMA
mgnify:CR=1 FL=1